MPNHGHVKPNPDGSKARCGGPGLCAECSREAAERWNDIVNATRKLQKAYLKTLPKGCKMDTAIIELYEAITGSKFPDHPPRRASESWELLAQAAERIGRPDWAAWARAKGEALKGGS